MTTSFYSGSLCCSVDNMTGPMTSAKLQEHIAGLLTEAQQRLTAEVAHLALGQLWKSHNPAICNPQHLKIEITARFE
jgi:hypothetical protein